MIKDELGNLRGATVVVTGGAGFIGSHLVRALVRLGARTRVLDDLSTGRRENIAECLPHLDWHEASLTDAMRVAEALEGADYVLHHGAIPSVQRSVDDPETTQRANVEGTLTLLQQARNAGVRRVVYASSSAVYGNPERMPVSEALPTCPLSPYAVQKLAAEHYCTIFHSVYGLETVSLRYFNVFGPGQDPGSPYAAVIPKMVEALMTGRPFRVYGDGEQTRDFTHVENIVRANLLALTVPQAAGHVVNVACGSAVSLNELVEGVCALSGRNLEVEHLPARPGEVRHSVADITAARAVLGYSPTVGIWEGLESTLNWFVGEGARIVLDGVTAGNQGVFR